MTDLAPGMRPNLGKCPIEAQGKRVIVQLRNGSICGEEPVTTATPPGWAADGRGACRWTLRKVGHDIIGWRLVSG